MVFPCSLSDSKSPQMSRTLLGILAELNAVVWMISARPLISKFSSPLTKPFRIFLSPPVTIAITVIFMFYSLFVFLAFWSLYFVSFTFHSGVHRGGKIRYSAGCIYLFIYFFFWLPFRLVSKSGFGDLFLSTFNILLCLVNFYFYIVGSYVVILCCY